MKSRNWLGCHRRMYEWYGGVPHATVPDLVANNKIRLMFPSLSCAA